MVRFEFTAFDEYGMPTRVVIADSSKHIVRDFDPNKDGWMLDQLDPDDFPEVASGKRVERMIGEINALRREVFELKKKAGVY